MQTEEFYIKKTAKNSIIYFATSILQKALSFFLLPLYTIYLLPEDYGLVSLILAFFGVVSLFITLALNGALSRYYFVYKNDVIRQKKFLGTIIFTVILNSLFWFLLIIIFRDTVSNNFIKGISFFPYVFIALLSTITSPTYLLYQTFLQIKQEAKTFSFNSISFFAVAITLNIVLIVGLKMGALGLLIANAIPNIIFSLYAVISLIAKRHIIFVLRINDLKEALRFSIPLIPHLLSGTIADYIARNILYLQTSLSKVGLYNIAFQFGNILDLIVSSVSNAILPLIYNTLDKKKDLIKLISTTTLILRVISLIAIIISVYSKEFVYLMTSNAEYYPSWKAIPIIALSTLFSFLYGTYVTLLFYNVIATRYIWIASMTGNITNIGFTVYFTDKFSFLTPAIALVIQRSIMFLIVYFISRIKQPVNYNLRTMLLTIFIFIVLTLIGIFPDFYNQKLGLSFPLLAWKLFVILIAAFLLLRKDWMLIYSFVLTNLKQYLKIN